LRSLLDLVSGQTHLNSEIFVQSRFYQLLKKLVGLGEIMRSPKKLERSLIPRDIVIFFITLRSCGMWLE
ncbi:MAG: hypothetical protein WBM86_03785, partial [Waterburya sp.]